MPMNCATAWTSSKLILSLLINKRRDQGCWHNKNLTFSIGNNSGKMLHDFIQTPYRSCSQSTNDGAKVVLTNKELNFVFHMEVLSNQEMHNGHNFLYTD